MEIPPGYRVVRQQVHVLSDQNERVYWTGTFVQADTDMEIAWRIPPPFNPSPARDGDMLGTLTNTSDYNVVSALPQVSIAQLRGAGNDYPPDVTSNYLRLPESVPERVLGLAHEIAEASLTPFDRALAIEAYLRGYPYTLDVKPPPPGQDVVDYFLFTAQKGYCTYYASAMVVLSRAAGLPARIVFGYSSGSYNPTTAQYQVRQENAHAWPEIYFPGIGWVEFEPTASLPEISRPVVRPAPQPVPGASPDISWKDWLMEQWRSLTISTAGWMLLAVAGCTGIFAIWQASEIWFLQLMPAPRAICSLYTRLENNSQRLLPGLIRGHTPHELKDALIHQMEKMEKRPFRTTPETVSREVEQIVSLYEEQVFSQKAPEQPQIRAGIKAWAHLRWALRINGGFPTLNRKKVRPY